MKRYDYSIHYGRFHDDSESHARDMAKGLQSLLQPYLGSDREAPILDVGCGYGFALRALRSLGYSRLVGVEISEEQAARCRRAGFDVIVCDDTTEWLNSKPEAFETILLLDVLEHIEVDEQIDFLQSIHKSLRPGGRVILTVPNANAILANRWRYIDYTHCCSFTEHSLFFVLKNAGFEQITLDNSKGLGRIPVKLWHPVARASLRKWIIRWCWLQVFKAEIPWERIDDISFDLNLRAVARKSGHVESDLDN